MAYQETHISHATDLPHRLWNGFKSLFSILGSGMMSAASANQRLHLVDQLNAKSDEELAAFGLRRDEIVRYVFRDMMDV